MRFMVLFIEDDPATIETIELCFNIYWPEATLTTTTKGLEGIELLRRKPQDLVILDLGLPDIDGMMVLESIRRFSSVPVLIVSARDTQAAVLKGLELGADDYIIKPFKYQLLQARMESILRPSRSERRISGGGLAIDLTTGQVALHGHPVALTRLEQALLAHLVEHEGKIVPLQRLAKQVWKSDSIDSPAIRATVAGLRTKLGDNPHTPKIILSEHEVGYRFIRPE